MHIGSDSIPIPFLYFSTAFMNTFSFMMTYPSEFPEIRGKLKNPKTNYVVFPEGKESPPFEFTVD